MSEVDLEDVRSRLAGLEALDAELAEARGLVADARAALIAGTAAATSARKTADALGLSLAAVAKATARSRKMGEP